MSYGNPDYTTTDTTDIARADGEVQKVLSLPVGGIVWLTNSLPYAARLENGWSQQAPAGFVRLAVQRVKFAAT